MKLLLLTMFGMGVTMSVTAPTVLSKFESEFAKMKELLAMSEQVLKGMVGDGEPFSINASEFAVANLCAPEEPKVGLKVVHLQTASGVQSGARGLTPEAEWRKIFPHPVGYSR